MQNLRIEILSRDEIRRIHEASLEVLDSVGIAIADEEARRILANAGCSVCEESKIVKIPSGLIEDALSKCPKSFVLHGRDRKYDVKMVSDGSVTNYINLGIGTRVTEYLGRGQYRIRDSTLADTADFAKVFDACGNLNWMTQPSSALDLMAKKCVRTLHEVNALMSNTAKPILPDPNYQYVDSYFEMMKAVYSGDEEEARKNSFFIIGGTSSSPLQLDVPDCQLMIRGAKLGMPIMTMTMEMAGTTAPVHEAGTLVLHNCEALTNILLAQLCMPGTRCLYGTATTNFDFANNTAPFGSPQAALLSSAIAQIAQYYGLPSITTGGGSDSIHVDVQSGHESTMTALLTALSGSNNVFGSGLLELGMSFSLEQLVLRNEMIDQEQRILRGIRVDDETLSLSEIMQAGVGGDFITMPATVSAMSDVQTDRLFNKSMYDEWADRDSKDALERAHDRVQDILVNHRTTPIEPDARKAIDALIRKADEKLKE